jgi:hypothetical protein
MKNIVLKEKYKSLSTIVNRLKDVKILPEGVSIIAHSSPVEERTLKVMVKNFRIISKILARVVQTKKFCEIASRQSEQIEKLVEQSVKCHGKIKEYQTNFWRPDIYVTSTGPKFLEINFGPNLGGLEISLLERFFREKKNSPLSGELDSLSFWSEFIRKTCKCNSVKSIFFVDTDSGIPSTRGTFIALKQELSEKMPEVNIQLMSLRQYFLLNPSEKHLLYRYCDITDVYDSQENLAKLIDLEHRLEVIEPVPLYRSLMESKACLGLIWELMGSNFFSLAESEVVESTIPRTWILDKERLPFFCERQTRMVLKPAFGSGGERVICGWDTTANSWAASLRESVSSPFGSWVLQEVAHPLAETVEVLLPNGEVEKWDARVLYGPRFHGEQYVGGIVRANRLSNSPVVNLRNGAAIGPLKVREEILT